MSTVKTLVPKVLEFTVTTEHRYVDGLPETVAWVTDPSGRTLADGEWSTHLSPSEVAGKQVDTWLAQGAKHDGHIGCGWTQAHSDDCGCEIATTPTVDYRVRIDNQDNVNKENAS